MSTAAVLSADALRADPEFLRSDWYHQIELCPEVVTPGRELGNLAAVRTLLERCEVEGARCLDIGAMEGLLSVLLTRRDAASVMAYDRYDCSASIDFVKQALDVEFEYVTGAPLTRLPGIVRERGQMPFDLIVFSGVLYHMFEPLAGLARVRSMVRDGGLVVIETAVKFEEDPAMSFNAAARYYAGTNYWMITVGCLDYLCRFLRLAPIDVTYTGGRRVNGRPSTGAVGRMAITCRAVNDCPAEDGDAWMRGAWLDADLEEHVDFAALAAGDRPALAYRGETPGLVRRVDTGTVDLWASAQSIEPTCPRKEQSILRLGDRY